MEFLDIYDEEGNFIGKEDRKIVHEQALWHKTIHCWLYDKEGNVYFQIRKDKNKLYTTASGHVSAGETLPEAFGREIREELGFKVNYENAELIEVNKYILDRQESDGSIFKDRAFANVYACLFEGELTEFNFDEEELNGVVKINAKKALEVLQNEKGNINGNKCIKENNNLKVKDCLIDFEDFLINPGETGIGKYGKVLEFIIKLTEK